MNKLRIICLILIVVVLPSLTVKAPSITAANTEVSPAKTKDFDSLSTYYSISAKIPPIYAKNYLLIDGNNTQILAQKNDTERVAIASTTKMVTALTVRRLYQLSDVVTVSSVPPGINGSSVLLRKFEKITVESLLYGLLIQSGNDTAYALAEHLGGNEPLAQFVEEMNKTVELLGLTNTKLADPAGLSELGYSTAQDLSLIAIELLKDPVLSAIVSTPKTTVYSTDGSIAHDLTSSNRLLLSDSSYYLPNAIGVKTGFTLEAGHCLVAAYRDDSHFFISVILNTTESTITASAQESRKLLVWALTNAVKNIY